MYWYYYPILHIFDYFFNFDLIDILTVSTLQYRNGSIFCDSCEDVMIFLLIIRLLACVNVQVFLPVIPDVLHGFPFILPLFLEPRIQSWIILLCYLLFIFFRFQHLILCNPLLVSCSSLSATHTLSQFSCIITTDGLNF